MFDWLGISISTLEIPCNQAIQVVAVRSIRPKGPFVEQTLNSTTHADLIGMVLHAHGPTHFAVPAAAKYHQGGSGYARGHHSQRPSPTRLLLLFNHRPQPCNSLKNLNIHSFFATPSGNWIAANLNLIT
jgi:hypothetical protein